MDVAPPILSCAVTGLSMRALHELQGISYVSGENNRSDFLADGMKHVSIFRVHCKANMFALSALEKRYCGYYDPEFAVAS